MSYRLQILHGSLYGYSEQITKVKKYISTHNSAIFELQIPERTMVHQSKLERTRVYQTIPECAKVYQSMPEYTRVYHSLPECTWVYQIVQVCTKVY